MSSLQEQLVQEVQKRGQGQIYGSTTTQPNSSGKDGKFSPESVYNGKCKTPSTGGNNLTDEQKNKFS